MKATLALWGWSLWFATLAASSAYAAIGDIRGSDDVSAAMAVATTLVFAGRSTHYANLAGKP